MLGLLLSDLYNTYKRGTIFWRHLGKTSTNNRSTSNFHTYPESIPFLSQRSFNWLHYILKVFRYPYGDNTLSSGGSMKPPPSQSLLQYREQSVFPRGEDRTMYAGCVGVNNYGHICSSWLAAMTLALWGLDLLWRSRGFLVLMVRRFSLMDCISLDI